jgi:hypothetical protein
MTRERVGAADGELEGAIWVSGIKNQVVVSSTQRETAEQLPMVVGSSAFDDRRMHDGTNEFRFAVEGSGVDKEASLDV